MKHFLPKNMRNLGVLALFLFGAIQLQAQDKEVISTIVEKVNHESEEQLQLLAHELMDQIGPRLVGTPQMEASHHWVVDKYRSWGIDAENQQWGEWRAWERGISHIHMVEPRVQSLSGMQLAWSPSTPKKGITAEVILLPEKIQDSISFAKWLPNVKGKLVMVSMPEPTGRPDATWEKFATEKSLEKMQNDRNELREAWHKNISNTGYNSRSLQTALEEAGAAGIVSSYWSKEYGSNKIFGAVTKKIPTVDISQEDYGMVYRLAQSGKTPKLHLVAESKGKGTTPTFNTVARIEGKEKPEEYVILSAHLDSWDGGTGATDNGTGTITMMEVARILKEVYPNPKRTIIIGHWGSEEQGLNGSRAFVEDHPEIMETTRVVFNQDNGTGRVVSINGQGFLHSYDFMGRWLRDVPREVSKHIETTYPGMPWGGGSDHASFVAAGVPGFMLSSLNWEYGKTTWHTNLDTYDKIVFDDLKNNVILIASLAYLASEDTEEVQRDQVKLPVNPRTGEQMNWPEQRSPNRKGGMD